MSLFDTNKSSKTKANIHNAGNHSQLIQHLIYHEINSHESQREHICAAQQVALAIVTGALLADQRHTPCKTLAGSMDMRTR